MKRFSFGSLRTRLILLVLLAIIPALGLTLYSGFEQRDHAFSRAQEDALRMAENASRVQERLIENTRQIFFTLSQMPEVQQLNPKGCSKIFSSLQKQTTGYTNFFAVKPNGEVFASALPMSGHVSFADRPWYRHILKTREFIISDYVIGRITGKAAVTLVYPVLGTKGQFKAILGTGLDLGWLNQFMTQSKPPPGTTLNVIDSKGTILLRYPEPEKFIGKTMPEESILKAILAKGEGVSEATGLDGVARLYGFTSLDRFSGSVYVTVGIPREIAFAEAMRDLIRNLVWLAIVAALAIGAAWVAGGLLIIKPVNRLLGITDRLGAGDLIARIGPRYERGELGQLGKAFDQMADSLQKRETERIRAEKAILESEAKYRIVANNTYGWEFWQDPRGHFLYVSPSCKRITGYEVDDFIKDSSLLDRLIHPDDRSSFANHRYEAEQKTESSEIEFRIIHRDGGSRWIGHVCQAVFDENKAFLGTRGSNRDITERKRAEEEEKRLTKELNHNVVQLKTANKELEAFSYSVSHDLRAPLRAIDGFSRAILEDYVDHLDHEGKRFLDIIRSNTQKMGQLIDDLLVFSRLGRQEIRISKVDIENLAKDVFEELKDIVSERTIQFDIRELSSAQGDKAMIRQVFVNLLSNAIKFTRPKQNTTIEVGGSNEGSENIYYIRDNGVGFDMQYENKLFGVFQRLHSTEEFEGTGVGLAIVQRIIHRHGGRVWAEGKLNEGATFYFSLPAK